MYIVEKVGEDWLLYDSLILYAGQAFPSRQKAEDYLFKQTGGDNRTECPHCNFKWIMQPYPARHEKLKTHCPNCLKFFDRPNTGYERDFNKVR